MTSRGGRRGNNGQTGVSQPTWLMTFADLMTLLLTFFILLLSFSSMDTEKYKAIANAMSQSFGVSFVASSQGVPDLQALTLAVESSVAMPETPKTAVIPSEKSATMSENKGQEAMSLESAENLARAAQFAENEDLATAMIIALEKQIDEGDVTVQYDGEEVLLRFSEKATFGSGSEILQSDMRDVFESVVGVLKLCEGGIMVTGHSDDRPVGGGRFRSNWDLSAARAVSVVHELVLDGSLDASRVLAVGHAETRPLLPNDTAENRALNRRVEIHVQGAECRLDEL